MVSLVAESVLVKVLTNLLTKLRPYGTFFGLDNFFFRDESSVFVNHNHALPTNVNDKDHIKLSD